MGVQQKGNKQAPIKHKHRNVIIIACMVVAVALAMLFAVLFFIGGSSAEKAQADNTIAGGAMAGDGAGEGTEPGGNGAVGLGNGTSSVGVDESGGNGTVGLGDGTSPVGGADPGNSSVGVAEPGGNAEAPSTGQQATDRNGPAPEDTLFYINGKPIPSSVFYYHLYNSFIQLENMAMTNNLDFNTDMGEGMTLGQYAISNSIDIVKFGMAMNALADEIGIDMARAEAEVDMYLASTLEEAFLGDEGLFREQLAVMGTTLESFRGIMITQSLGGMVFDHYYGETGAITVSPPDYYSQFVTATAILLLTVNSEYNQLTGEMDQTPLSSEEAEQKHALAEAILKQLDEGADFFELLNEHGEDPGVMVENNPGQRYTFQGSEMPFDFSIAAFSLEVGEHSGIVETAYGLNIIYRLPLDTDAVDATVESQAFRNGLFNLMLDGLTREYEFVPTTLYDNSSLDTWYREYKDKNYQTFE